MQTVMNADFIKRIDIMEMKRYTDIERLKDKYREVFTKGELITITEKVDGSNASIRYDEETDSLVGFSRNRQVSVKDGLQGFFDFVQTRSKSDFKAVLGTRYIIFGEWLVKHTVQYPAEAYKNFYVFDVWDTKTERYCPHSVVAQIAVALDLDLVPIFYIGAFKGWDMIEKYVGKTKMNAEPCGEGIIVKSQDRLDNKFSGTPAYVKIVSESFSETKKTKKTDTERSEEYQADLQLAQTIVTKRRVEKLLQKFVESGELPENFDEHQLKEISRILPKACYDDCMKEEPETAVKIKEFGKLCSKLCMQYAKQIIFGE